MDVFEGLTFDALRVVLDAHSIIMLMTVYDFP